MAFGGGQTAAWSADTKGVTLKSAEIREKFLKFFEDKGKGKYNAANIAALRKGFDAV